MCFRLDIVLGDASGGETASSVGHAQRYAALKKRKCFTNNATNRGNSPETTRSWNRTNGAYRNVPSNAHPSDGTRTRDLRRDRKVVRES